MKYLVTGSSGFIGTHLTSALIADGHEVVPFDLQDQTGDIRNPEDFKDIKGLDGVYHLAAIASVQETIKDPKGTYENNVLGTRNVFDFALGANLPVVYASSAAVYGDNQNLPLSEDEAPKPMSPYAEQKLQNESDANSYAQKGLKSFGVRFFNIYGPGQDPTSPYSGVISIFHERLKTAQTISIYGDGEQSRDFVYVSDAVKALTYAMKNASTKAPYANVCTQKTITLNRLYEIMRTLLKSDSKLAYQPAREGDIRHSEGDARYMLELTGYKYDCSLEEGMTRLIREA